MTPLLISLTPDLVRALQDLAAWERRREIAIAADLVQLALESAAPERDLRFRLATLTDRERELAVLISRGHTSRQICQSLSISSNTLKTHTRAIRRKLNLNSVAEIHLTLSSYPFP